MVTLSQFKEGDLQAIILSKKFRSSKMAFHYIREHNITCKENKNRVTLYSYSDDGGEIYTSHPLGLCGIKTWWQIK